MSPARGTPGDDAPRRRRSAPRAGRPTGPTRLEGRVHRAGEGACLHLEFDGVTYELLGATTGLVVGRGALVTGRVDRTVQSQCGGGTPFIVTTAAPQPARGR